jgi:diguanylate cyclase (GGDEF)-like protein
MYTFKETPFNVVTLAFLNSDLERAFQKDYFEKTLFQIRLALLFAAVLYAMFGILDNLVIPGIKQYAWLIRFFLICPLLLVTFVLTYTRFFRRLMRLLLFLAGFASGAGIVVMIVIAPSPGNHLYYSGVLLCVLFYFVFVPDFMLATILSWSIFAVYVFMVYFCSHISLPALMNNTTLFVAYNITGMVAGYTFERYMRSDFLQRRIIHERTEELKKALLDVEKARGKAEELSQLDPLTGLFNRRHFFSIAEQELARNIRHHHCLSLIMMDIDHFKSINDKHGHCVGDLVLREVGEKIRNTLRRSDTPCRYGGEEFAILMPETDSFAALMIGSRLQKVVEETIVETDKGPVIITISVGIATMHENGHAEIHVLMDQADQALYEAKKAGRNQVKLWNQEIEITGIQADREGSPLSLQDESNGESYDGDR